MAHSDSLRARATRLALLTAVALAVWSAAAGTAAAAETQVDPCGGIRDRLQALLKQQEAYRAQAASDGTITPDEIAAMTGISTAIAKAALDIGNCQKTGIPAPGYPASKAGCRDGGKLVLCKAQLKVIKKANTNIAKARTVAKGFDKASPKAQLKKAVTIVALSKGAGAALDKWVQQGLPTTPADAKAYKYDKGVPKLYKDQKKVSEFNGVVAAEFQKSIAEGAARSEAVESIAKLTYGKGFFDLTEDQQAEVWTDYYKAHGRFDPRYGTYFKDLGGVSHQCTADCWEKGQG